KRFEVIAVAGLVHFLDRYELQRRRVDAVPHPALVSRAVIKTWPRCESATLERTSVRAIPKVESFFSTTSLPFTGLVKLGQPVPESNLSSELNSGSPETTSTYSPALWLSQ